MDRRTCLHTVRLSAAEAGRVKDYLRSNTVFDSFSSLARVATLSFIGEARTIRLDPQPEAARDAERLLWDYDLTRGQAREILGQRGLTSRKLWLIGKLLAEVRFEEAVGLLDLDEVREAMPKLRLPPPVRARWEYALQRWARG